MATIVLLPGMDGTGKMFAEFVSSLEGDFRPIVVSYPADHALGYRELEAFARGHLPENEPYILLGESFSGPIAISLAASKPAGLIGLVLCCTFARNPLPYLGFLKNLISVLPFNARMAGICMPLLVGRYSAKKLRTTLQQALQSVTASTLRARLIAVLEIDVSKNLQQIDVPILYLQASLDRIVLKSAALYMQSLAGHMHVIKLRGPHLLLQAMPKEAARIVKNFAAELSTAYKSPLHTNARTSG